VGTIQHQSISSIHWVYSLTLYLSFNRASGSFCFAPAIFAVIATVLSIVALSKCDLVQPAPDVTDNWLYNIFSDLPDSMGLYCWETNGGEGRGYGDTDQLDESFHAARTMGVLAVMLGIFIVFAFAFAGCRRFGKCGFFTIAFLAIVNMSFQSLVFLVFKSDVCAMECFISTGGKVAIVSALVWGFTGLLTICAGVGSSSSNMPSDTFYYSRSS
jgi:hypothetical protein